jgi:hypothetical protein
MAGVSRPRVRLVTTVIAIGIGMTVSAEEAPPTSTTRALGCIEPVATEMA